MLMSKRVGVAIIGKGVVLHKNVRKIKVKCKNVTQP